MVFIRKSDPELNALVVNFWLTFFSELFKAQALKQFPGLYHLFIFFFEHRRVLSKRQRKKE